MSFTSFHLQPVRFSGSDKTRPKKPHGPVFSGKADGPVLSPRQQAFVAAFSQANPEQMASTFAEIANEVVNTNRAGIPLYPGSTTLMRENLFDRRMQVRQADEFEQLLREMKSSPAGEPFYKNMGIYLQNRDLRISVQVDKGVSIDEHPDDGRFWIRMKPNSPAIEINGEGDYFRANWQNAYSSEWIPLDI